MLYDHFKFRASQLSLKSNPASNFPSGKVAIAALGILTSMSMCSFPSFAEAVISQKSSESIAENTASEPSGSIIQVAPPQVTPVTTGSSNDSEKATGLTSETLSPVSAPLKATAGETSTTVPQTADKATEEQTKSDELAMLNGAVSTESKVEKADIGPVIIDNDEATEIKQTIEYKELETDAGGTKVKAGATFPVVISSQITSKSANNGDPFEARLKYDLKIGDRLVAEKGSAVIGHVNYVLKARSAMHSLVSAERWYRNSGCLGVSFDEIVNNKGEHIPLVATPARQARIIKNKAEGRELGVNHNGQVTGPWSQQLRYKAIRIGLNAAMAPAGVFSFGAMPVALGVIGAANPSFAFMKPVGQNVRHRRIKGFVWGALSGVPGSWIVEDTVVKGQEAVIKPGDEFLAEFKEEFTGEPETEATLIPGASTKVKGQVVPVKKTKK